MASGFIILRNGEYWSHRWTGYDRVLEAIMNELPEEGDAKVLREWISYILPDEEAGDIECCYAFIKAEEWKYIPRVIDTRLMKEPYRNIFGEALSSINSKPDQFDHYLQAALKNLYQMYQRSLEEEFQAVENDDNRSIFFVGGFSIGVE